MATILVVNVTYHNIILKCVVTSDEFAKGGAFNNKKSDHSFQFHRHVSNTKQFYPTLSMSLKLKTVFPFLNINISFLLVFQKKKC